MRKISNFLAIVWVVLMAVTLLESIWVGYWHTAKVLFSLVIIFLTHLFLHYAADYDSKNDK